jgi:ELWxxDGT repeat protein
VVASSFPRYAQLREVLGKVFFLGWARPAVRPVLWASDGTAAGTRRFTDTPPQITLTLDYVSLGAVGSRLLFGAGEGSERELWISDGEPGGTRLLREIGRDAPDSWPSQLVAAGDRLFFRASDGTCSRVWQSHQAAAPTQFDLPPPQCRLLEPPQDLETTGGMVFFWRYGDHGGLQLWRSDGTAEGTVRLTSLTSLSNPSEGDFLVALGDEVFFPAVVDVGDAFREQVWTSDGTEQGTGFAFELPGSRVPTPRVAAAGGALYFAVWLNTSPTSYEIWRSDGDQAGTERLLQEGKRLPPGGPQFTAVGQFVFFTVMEPESPYTSELWIADGANAVRVATFAAPLVGLVEFQGLLHFLVRGDGVWELWRSDGTSAGTVRLDTLPDPDGSAAPASVAVAGGRLFVFFFDWPTDTLWVSDGTAGSFRLLADLAPPLPFYGSTTPAVLGERLFFIGHDPVHGYELWVSDGSEAGTRLVHDIAPGPESSHPVELTAAGGRLFFSADDGVHGRELWVLDLGQPPGVCQPTSTALCLGGRFRVEAAWKDFAGNSGVGQSVPLTADTGAFWFFGPENIEVILKVLDGRSLNEHHWVFYGALSSVEYALTVTDVTTGSATRYWNPSGQLASVADTTGFGPLGALSVVERSLSGSPPRVRSEGDGAGTAGCIQAPTRLCLGGGRFAVEATWKDFSGNTGVGTAVPLSGDTGYFWFFAADNVEVVLKVLDGTALNGKHWVFYGALSSVEYTLRVTDTATGVTRTYFNPSGNLASVADTSAF